MLKYISIVTIVVAQLGQVEESWREHLGYETVHSGLLSPEVAALWDAPAMAGRPFLVMQPASAAPVYVRFVEGELPPDYAPMRSWGWNATELLVLDPDELAARLEAAEAPFRIIGPPADLYEGEDAPRAMQAIGPGEELIYFTRIIPSGTQLRLSGAVTEVDRVFITVVAGGSLAELEDFYRERLRMPVTGLGEWEIAVLAETWDLPADTRFPLSVAEFPQDYLIELDEYPDGAGPRTIPEGAIPPGLSIVSVIADDLGQLDVEWRQAPAVIAEFPYSGRRSAVTVGPAGEWIEVIEAFSP